MSDKVETFQTFEIFDSTEWCYRVKDFNVELGEKTGITLEYCEQKDGEMKVRTFITMNYETANAIAQAINKINYRPAAG